MVASGLKWLLDAGMKAPTGISGDVVGKYFDVLKDVPTVGLRTAFTKLKKGLYENINLDFIPTPATMAAMARLEAKPVLEHRARLSETRATLEDLSKKEKKSPEQIKRVREMRIQLKAFHEASKASENKTYNEPMTAEKETYWKKIAAMPDVQNLKAEQEAFRRNIKAKLTET